MRRVTAAATAPEVSVSRSAAAAPVSRCLLRFMLSLHQRPMIARTRFDPSRSDVGDSVNIIKTIERMTGFTCTRMIQSGQELDMIVGGNVLDFAHEEDLPPGVANLTVLDKNTIRVAYHPKIVGARELLAHPIFRLAKLALSAVRSRIASGRTHVRMTFFMTILSILLTIPVLILAWAPLPAHKTLYGAISLALATTGQVVIAGPFNTGALKALVFSRMIEMDLLTVLGAFHRRVVFNFTWASVYNVLAILLAAKAFPHARIPPQYAGLREIVCVLPVIVIAIGVSTKTTASIYNIRTSMMAHLLSMMRSSQVSEGSSKHRSAHY